MIDSDLAYAAGLVDGEGCIRIAKNKALQRNLHARYILFVKIQMTEPDALNWLAKNWGGNVRARREKSYKDHWKVGFHWCISSKKAYHFLKQITPYLKIKFRQAKIGIVFQEELIVKPLKNRIKKISGSFVKGQGERSKELLNKQESLYSLVKRFNQHGCIWSGVLENIKDAEKYFNLGG